jgi:hypothetical protein
MIKRLSIDEQLAWLDAKEAEAWTLYEATNHFPGVLNHILNLISARQRLLFIKEVKAKARKKPRRRRT